MEIGLQVVECGILNKGLRNGIVELKNEFLVVFILKRLNLSLVNLVLFQYHNVIRVVGHDADNLSGVN